jgi:hypothetical protein
MNPRAPVTLSNENDLSRCRPSLHRPAAACARYELATAAGGPNPFPAHSLAGREVRLVLLTLWSAGRRSAEAGRPFLGRR